MPNAAPETPVSPLTGRTLAFFARLRRAGLPVAPARTIDALRALQLVDVFDEDDYRLALRVNVVASPEQERLFEQVFAEHFRGAPDTRRYPSGIRGEAMQGQLGHHYKDLDQQVTVDPAHFSNAESERDTDLAERWSGSSGSLPGASRRARAGASAATAAGLPSTSGGASAAARGTGSTSSNSRGVSAACVAPAS